MDIASRRKLINRAAFRISLKIIKNPVVETSSRTLYCFFNVGEDSKELNETKIKEYFKKLLKHDDFQFNKVDNDSNDSNLVKYLLSIKRKITSKNLYNLIMEDSPQFDGKYKVLFKLATQNNIKNKKKN